MAGVGMGMLLFAQKPVNAAIGGGLGALVGGSVGGGSPLIVAASTGVGAALGCQMDPVGKISGYNTPTGASGSYDVTLAVGAGALSYLMQSMGLFGLSGVMQGAVAGAGASTVLMLSGSGY